MIHHSASKYVVQQVNMSFNKYICRSASKYVVQQVDIVVQQVNMSFNK